MKKTKLVQITRQDKITEDEFNPFVNRMFEEVWGKLFPPQILTEGLSNTVEKSIVTQQDSPIPDCTTCGACCAAFVCVDVVPDSSVSRDDCWDIVRDGKQGEYIVDRLIKRKEEDFSCVALEGTIGEKVNCRVYEDRPRVCRIFEAGSDRCHAVRRAYGIEPFLDLMEMFEANSRLKNQDESKSELAESVDSVRIVENSKDENLEVYLLLNDGSEHLVHTFDRNIETWFKSEFDGITISKAKDLVANRNEIG